MINVFQYLNIEGTVAAMSEFDIQMPSNTPPPDSIEEFLAKNLSSSQKEVLEFLCKNLGDDAYKLYKAGIYALKNKDFPAREMVMSCCFYELTNVFIQTDENEYKKQLRKALQTLEFGQKGYNQSQVIEDIVNNKKVWDEVKKLANNNYKLNCFTKQFLLTIKEEDLDSMINNVLKARRYSHSNRHYNKTKSSQFDFDEEMIKPIENYINSLNKPPYSEKKEDLDDVLAKANKSKQGPKEDELKEVIDNLNGNLRQYFFSKLENPEWFNPLSKKGLLYFHQFIDEDDDDVIIWDAAPYLIRVASEKPDEVLNVIKPFLDDIKRNKKINIQALNIVLEIAISIAGSKKEDVYNTTIAKGLLSWLKYTNSINDRFDYKNVIKLLKTLTNIGDESFASQIFLELLKLSVIVEYKDSLLSDIKEKCLDFKIVTKFDAESGMGDYYYEKICKEGKNIFQCKQKELFDIYLRVVKNLLLNNTLISEHNERFADNIAHHLRAIEEHAQNSYEKNEPFFIVFSALRDVSESLIKTNEKNNIDFVFESLKAGTSKIFIRLMLHLVRMFPDSNKELIERYLTEKDYFYDMKLHHEYYLLIQQEFKNLPDDKQNIILKYIEDGPETEYEQKNSWIWHKLEPIRKDLPKGIQEKYKDILFDKYGQELHHVDHPEFLIYSYSAWGTVSPIKDEEIKNMSIDNVIKSLKSWEPPKSNGFREPTIIGMAESLEKDVKENPEKYLNDILKFKEISEPTYIGYLFNALSFIKKTSKDWNNIIELGLWSLEQSIPKDEIRDTFNAYNDWGSTHIALLRLFMQLTSLDDSNDLSKELMNSLYQIIVTLVFADDKYLLSKKEKRDDDYYNNAINSLHGIAVKTLIEFALWLNRQKLDNTFILQNLDKLLDTSKYIETWAVFGRFLPWIDLMFHDWTIENINKILPEDNRDNFDAAWITYIKLVNPYDNMLELIKPKIEYVLEKKLYAGVDKDERDISKHIAIYYAREKISLEDRIIELVFDIPENKKEIRSLMNFIGFCLRDTKKEIHKKMIDRFKLLWELWEKKIVNKERENSDILKEFQWWYCCKRFDREWAINQIQKLIVKYKCDIEILMIEEVLLEDLPIFTRKVFEIIRALTMKDKKYPYSETKVLKETIKYIKESNTSDSTLKKEKNDFINKLAEIRSDDGLKLFDELKEYLELKKLNSLLKRCFVFLLDFLKKYL
jgi:hypothetical protein